MKKLAFSILSVAFVSPVFAADQMGAMDYAPPPADQVSGSVGASVGALVATSDGDSETATVYNINGKLNYRFDPNWNAQFDARYNGVTADGNTFSAFGGAVHIFRRDPGAYAVGGFVSYDWLSIDDIDGDLSSYRFGPEFQIYNGNLTYYAQAFWGQYLVDGDGVGTWGVRGEARYFHTENLRFEGELGFTQISDGGDDASIFTAGLEAEKRFDGTPFSVWGRYQYDHVNLDDESSSGHTFLVGFRAAFGTGSLLDEDRNGATMETPKSSQIF